MSTDKVFNVESRSLMISLIIVLIVFSLLNVYNLAGMNLEITGKTASLKEEEEPAKIQITKVVDSSCKDCFDINSIISRIEGSSTETTKSDTVEFSSSKGKDLINQYGIKKVPALVITGEVDKSTISSLWSQLGAKKSDGAVVYSAENPPYTDTSSGEIKGLVSLINILDSSCEECISMKGIVDTLKEAGVKVSTEKTLEYTSAEASDLIIKFGIQRIPALIVSKDITEYPAISQVWGQLNATEKDGFYALHATVPPYRDLASDEIEGLVTLIMITDDSCTDCYNVTTHKAVLPRFGINVVDEKTFDVSSTEGEELLNKYSITKVPTILLSPEAELYSAYLQVWKTVGTEELDGWFVFRATEQMGPYKDLSTGEVVESNA